MAAGRTWATAPSSGLCCPWTRGARGQDSSSLGFRAPNVNLTWTRPFFDLLTLPTLALLMTRIPLPQLLAGGLTIQIALGSASTAFSHALLLRYAVETGDSTRNKFHTEPVSRHARQTQPHSRTHGHTLTHGPGNQADPAHVPTSTEKRRDQAHPPYLETRSHTCPTPAPFYVLCLLTYPRAAQTRRG